MIHDPHRLREELCAYLSESARSFRDILRREGDRLRLEVWNDAPEAALPEPRRRRKSLGLAATRARLSRLFGDDARLDLCRSGPGVLAVLEIPYFDEPAALAS